eukprot:6212395-Pleurochrysis_carterae.AAC.2
MYSLTVRPKSSITKQAFATRQLCSIAALHHLASTQRGVKIAGKEVRGTASACDIVRGSRMDGDPGGRPSPPPSASAKRSLRTAIDGTPERPEPGRSRSTMTDHIDPTAPRPLQSSVQTSIRATAGMKLSP